MSKWAALAACFGAGVSIVVAGAAGAPARDHAAVALNVFAPGQAGSLSFTANSSDQIRLYEGLTPLQGSVGARDLTRYFKAETLGLGREKIVRREQTGRAGLRILRDRWGVPHIYGKTSADVAFGAGWVTAMDRGFLLQLLRGPGRIAALDVPGVDPFSVAGRRFTPTAATEAFLERQATLLKAQGPKGAEGLRNIDAYAAGINAANRAAGIPGQPWTRRDSIAMAALIASSFGKGGGDEARRAEFLSALQHRLGDAAGRAVWDDLRAQDDPDAPVAVSRRFAYGTPAGNGTGNVVIDEGSLKLISPLGLPTAAARHSASNALVVSARRSQNGHPLFVAGPQVGYSYPPSFIELDLHGGGIDARGVSFSGAFGVLIGRAKDYAWSAMSSHSDIIDQYAETLCGGDDVHYLYKGACRAMETVDAGTLAGATGGQPDTQLVFRTTVHGPVIGYATVGGRRVAISYKRATRGRDILSSLAFEDLNRNRVRSAGDFLKTMNRVEFAFNWVYADDRDIAYFSAGRLPLRPSQLDLGLPTVGTGEYEWRGFAPLKAHAQVVNPSSGAIAAWNNKPAPGYAAGDDTWTWGSVQRVDLLESGLAARRKHTPESVVAAMNRASTQDFRAARVMPVVSAVLRTGPAPSPRAQRLLELLDAWSVAGGSRLDRDLDGKIDDPGAAILDRAWPKLADAVMSPVLGPLVDRLARLVPRDEGANSQGSSYDGGWYGYVEKDLRALLGRPVKAPYNVRYCGKGDLAACRASLWAAIEAAGNELAAAQGADPAAWRADATRERISFAPGLLPRSMRWSNRPTFQQVMSFRSHRPRR